MKENKLHSAIKFGEENFMIDLYDNGTIYMNTLEYFRREENNENRIDLHEGLSFDSITSLTITVPLTDQQIDLKPINSKLRQEIKGNVYCMYGITSHWLSKNPKIDPRNAAFGQENPTMVVIHDLNTFLERIKSKLTELNHRWAHQLVEYCDEEICKSDLDVFKKPNRFAYQNEFRLFVPRQTSNKEELVFRIGSIADIAEIFKADNLEEIESEFIDEVYRAEPK